MSQFSSQTYCFGLKKVLATISKISFAKQIELISIAQKAIEACTRTLLG
jgi:hypothetical protein